MPPVKTIDFDDVASAHKAIAARWPKVPQWGIILGSGLGGFAEQLRVECSLAYGDIPHFPQATAIGHAGRLLCGVLGSQPVVAMQGRFHLYEGYTPAQIALPIRVMRALGASRLLVSNAAGGLNPHFQSADLMLIEDHLNLMMTSPLIGPHDERWGERFVDLSCPYDVHLRRLALESARRQDIAAPSGRVCRVARSHVRDTGRVSDAATTGRRRRGNVDGPRSHCGRSGRLPCPGHLSDYQLGTAGRSDQDGRARGHRNGPHRGTPPGPIGPRHRGRGVTRSGRAKAAYDKPSDPAA